MKKPNEGAAHSLTEDKGFYLILFLCIAAVAVAAWVLFASPAPVEADPLDGYLYEADDSVHVSDPVEQMPVEQPDEPVDETPAEPPAAQPEKPAEPKVKELVFTPPMDSDVSHAFSGDTLEYNETTCDWRTHDGVDYAGQAGDAVCAVADGTVLHIGDDAIYGKYIILSHTGEINSLYAGLDKICISEGDTVSGGNKIAVLGEPMPLEYADGVHLHFAVTKKNVAIDPVSLF